MPVHEDILQAAVRIAGARAGGLFTPDEIVRALPHLNAATVRTHVTSRCCVNAPKNHLHKWDYFRRVGRGRYKVLAPYRSAGGAGRVRETPARYAAATAEPQRHAVHAAITRQGDWLTAECLEIAVVTQGRTFDETLANLHDAITLHLEAEDLAALGLGDPIALHVTFEESLR
jgi:predicted RNase H-like HicB family nuclease